MMDTSRAWFVYAERIKVRYFLNRPRIPRTLYNFQALLNPHTSIPYVIFDSRNILCIFSSVYFFIMGVTDIQLCSFKGLLWLVSCFIPTSYVSYILPILCVSVVFNFLPFLKTYFIFRLHLIINLTVYKFYISSGRKKCACEWTTQPAFMCLRGRTVWTCWKVRLGKLLSFYHKCILRPLAPWELLCYSRGNYKRDYVWFKMFVVSRSGNVIRTGRLCGKCRALLKSSIVSH